MNGNYPDAVDAELWLEVLNRLKSVRAKMPKHAPSASYQIDPSHSPKEAEDHWFSTVESTDLEVTPVILHWLRHGDIPDSPLNLLWFFHVRLDQAIEFVENMTWTRGHLFPDTEWRSFVPFPKMTVDQVVECLLTEWWTFRGSIRFFDHYYPTYLLRRLRKQKTD